MTLNNNITNYDIYMHPDINISTHQLLSIHIYSHVRKYTDPQRYNGKTGYIGVKQRKNKKYMQAWIGKQTEKLIYNNIT